MESKETSKTKWQGKSKGNVLGYRIFVFLIKHLGIRSAYLLLVFVALYYFLSQWTSNGYLYRYFRHRLGYTPLRAVVSVYRNYYVFGQTIIDKIAIFSNLRHRFTYEFDGQEQLHKLLASHKGGVLISAHIGNFEVAEPFFREIDVECQIHTVTTDMERSAIKEYLESVSLKEYTPKFIFVKEDMSHIFEIHQALEDNGIICFTGDRYFEGTKHLAASLLGKETLFPAGPFLIASRLGVPVIFVYVMKEKGLHYHLYARMAQVKSRDPQALLEAFTLNMEQMIHKYPLQWFNYFDFWNEKKEAH